MPEEKKEDLKPEDNTSEGADQPEKKELAREETLKNEASEKLKKLEEDLAKEKTAREKAEQERENYKQGLLSVKSKKMTLSDDEKVVPESRKVEPPEEDESWKEVDRRAEKVAEEKFIAHTKVEAKQNERIAIKKFLGIHPEIDEALWGGVKEEYTDKHGKSVEGILLDLERGYKFYKLDNNLSFEKKEESKIDTLANLPGAVRPSESVGEFNENEQKIMKEYDIKQENFKQFRQKVLAGDISVPVEVLNLLKKD